MLSKWLILSGSVALALAAMTPQLVCALLQHSQLLDWSIGRTYQRVNAGRTWVPREGDAHPSERTDTYSRFMTIVKYDAATDTYGIFVDTWRYRNSRWYRAKSQRYATVDGDDNGENLGTARAEVQETVDRAQEQWANAWYELEGIVPPASDESIALKHRLAHELSQ